MTVLAPVSRTVRLALEARFGALFNDAMTAALADFGRPELAWAVNFWEEDGLPVNFFRGDRTLDELIGKVEGGPTLPALAMWTAEIQDQSREKPRRFSGIVAAYWRVWLFVRGAREKVDLVELREAVESAMIATLSDQPGAIGYRGDLGSAPLAEQRLSSQDEDDFGWVQEVTYTATFEVSV